jgi:hypothetical protein
MNGPPFIYPDAAGPRVVYCPDFHIAQSLRGSDSSGCVTAQWKEFAQQYPHVEAAVVVSGAVAGEDLPAQLVELGRRHPLPMLIVATQLDAPHLVPFRRVAVDEFLPLETLPASLPAVVNRIVLSHAREHLARHVEQLDRAGVALRAALARSLRQPARVRTIQKLADELGVSARTLENQWKTFYHGRGRSRLEDLLWVIRLIRVLELRASSTRLDEVCRIFDVDARSLRRASRRILGRPLGSISALDAVAEVARLRRHLTAEWQPPGTASNGQGVAVRRRTLNGASRRRADRHARV